MAKRDPANKKVYVIIGGGPAGLNCAETLRQSNYTGEILVISDDNLMPYDRTLLTKVIATGNASKFKLREDSFLAAHDINYKLNTRAQSVDTAAKTVKLSDGSVIVRSSPLILYLVLRQALRGHRRSSIQTPHQGNRTQERNVPQIRC